MNRNSKIDQALAKLKPSQSLKPRAQKHENNKILQAQPHGQSQC